MCTSLTLAAANQINTLSRTMDFAFMLDPQLVFIPRNYPMPSNSDGTLTPAKYAMMGIGGQSGSYVFADGVNEKGLACASLYFPGYARYHEDSLPDKTNLAPHEVVGWLLTNFASVAEVKDGFAQVNLLNRPVELLGVVTPLHWMITDSNGATIVIEPMAEGIKIYDHPLGVMTNSPDLTWHLTNVRNYIGVSPQKTPSITLNGVSFSPLGSGAGTPGLPGDYSPPSRFLRTLFGREAINDLSDEAACVNGAFHILAAVDIPKGSVIIDQGQIDFTQYTAAMVCNTGTYYVKTYDNNQIIRACLFHEDLNAPKPKVWELLLEQNYRQLN
jgi:choloylglycine hydrolase